MEELTHTLRLTDTRHLDHYTAGTAFHFLDIGLNNTELIDTVTHNVKRIVYGRFHFGTQGTLHFGVCALGANLAFHLLCSEDLRQTVAGSILLVVLDEQRDEVVLTRLFLLLRLLH